MSRLALPGSWLLLACAGALGCSNGDANTVAVATGGAAAGGQGQGGGANSSGGTSAEPSLLPPRIRRLTNAEYDATVQSLLGTQLTLGAEFVPDARLYKFGKFDRNEAQVVEPVLARQLQQAAETLASEYVQNRLDLALPCASQGDAECARGFFESFLPKAYRRPVTASELSDLLTLLVVPSIARDGFRAAIELGIAATLQSTGFLYHSELGAAENSATTLTLTNAEIAAAMSYLLTGAPTDAELASADLSLASNREALARHLLQFPGARLQVRRLVKQWLDIDQTPTIRKDAGKFPDFQPGMLDTEASEFVDEVVFTRRGGVKLLLGADFTVGSADLANFYGVPAPLTSHGIIDLSSVPRRGILNQGAFLASYATPEFPSPVRRGVRVLTQALCVDPGDPAALMLMVTPPPPDPSKTTRQRFEDHGQPGCSACHASIDSIGFSFEHFNAIGAWEANEDGKANLPIDSSATLRLPATIPFATQTVANSAELATLIADSEASRRCFARNLARFTTASYGESLEQAFVDEWQRLAAAGQDSVQELLVAYVKSRFFVERDAKGAGQ